MTVPSFAGADVRRTELTAEVVSAKPDLSAFVETWHTLFAARPCEPSTLGPAAAETPRAHPR